MISARTIIKKQILLLIFLCMIKHFFVRRYLSARILISFSFLHYLDLELFDHQTSFLKLFQSHYSFSFPPPFLSLSIFFSLSFLLTHSPPSSLFHSHTFKENHHIFFKRDWKKSPQPQQATSRDHFGRLFTARQKKSQRSKQIVGFGLKNNSNKGTWTHPKITLIVGPKIQIGSQVFSLINK